MSTAAATPEKAWMLATLKELAEIGMAQARELTAEPGSNTADAALRFARISRAVRQSVALYGLVLEDKLGDRIAGARPPKPPPAIDVEKGARVRADDLAIDIALDRMAPPQAVAAFKAEVEEWREGHEFDHLYAGRLGEVIAEILLMLGLDAPPGMIFHDQQQAMRRAFEAGQTQPWRAAWAFLDGRERPHLALLDGWDPWRSGRRPRQARQPRPALAEGP